MTNNQPQTDQPQTNQPQPKTVSDQPTLRLTNRRRFERFSFEPAYTEIRVRTMDEDTFSRLGHIHDLSEGGVRFELDEPIDPGTPVAVEIRMPGLGDGFHDLGPGRAVYAAGTIVWANEDDFPGPIRLAMTFRRFARAGDRERMMRRLLTTGTRRAA